MTGQGQPPSDKLRPPGPERTRPVSTPLHGKTVVVTRAARQVSALAERAAALGAEVLELPSIALAPPADGGAAALAAAQRLAAGGYAWVVFTSANAVGRFVKLLGTPPVLAGAKVAAVGPATSQALQAHGLATDLLPGRHLAQGLLECFPSPGPAGSQSLTGSHGGGSPPPRALLPQAAGARPQLRDGLAAQGWEVDTVEVYQVVPARIDPRLLLQAAEADAICFASSSAVTSYLDQAFAAHQGQTGPGEQRGGSRAGAPPGRLVPPIVVCIGPVTASTARSRGLEVASEAAEHDLDDLVAALVEALASRQPSD